MCERTIKRSEGFSFLEIIIAMIILTISVLGATLLSAWIARSTQFSGNTTDASALAQDKVEELISQDFDSLTGGSDTVDSFTRTWTVTATGNQKEISSTVTWESINRKNHSVTISTILTDDSFTVASFLPSFIMDVVPPGTYPPPEESPDSETPSTDMLIDSGTGAP